MDHQMRRILKFSFNFLSFPCERLTGTGTHSDTRHSLRLHNYLIKIQAMYFVALFPLHVKRKIIRISNQFIHLEKVIKCQHEVIFVVPFSNRTQLFARIKNWKKKKRKHVLNFGLLRTVDSLTHDK